MIYLIKINTSIILIFLNLLLYKSNIIGKYKFSFYTYFLSKLANNSNVKLKCILKLKTNN